VVKIGQIHLQLQGLTRWQCGPLAKLLWTVVMCSDFVSTSFQVPQQARPAYARHQACSQPLDRRSSLGCHAMPHPAIKESIHTRLLHYPPAAHTPCSPLCENVTLSTKLELHYVLHCHQQRTEPWPQLTCTENTRVDLIKPVSNVRPYVLYVLTYVHPQKVSLISVKFGM